MESAQLLDILGNENRRKILHLLASRPCYMSEIAERLDVGAKAVLGHLMLLERAGLIEATVDEQRRKYFHIRDNLRLEVFVSPYSFEVETTTIAVTTGAPLHHVKSHQANTGLKTLYGEIQGMLEHRQRVLHEYHEVQANLTEAMGQCMDAIEDAAEDGVEAEILYALLKGPLGKRALSMQLGLPEYALEEYLERMENKELIKEVSNNYSIG
ncbi:MAG: ArsR family transcriptional regulator [Candidatus Methanoperedens sp.]|nr:ArsR family transcriptional regulator [Candidatus Methanoperedens sp.]